MNQYARMIIVLMIISMASGAVLALSYEVTNPTIQEQARQKLEQSVLIVIPGATQMEEIQKDDITIYIGLDDEGNKKGIAFKTAGSGFNGPIEIMVGYDPKEGKLLGIEILSMSETPGLGARIQEEAFKDQFKGKSVEDEFVAKQDVEAISGATISSTAVASAIKTSLEKVVEIFPVGGDY
ncbi:MAG TPA: RnfABCDGE type electron transport complex subunit G [Thermoanaerobacterales bacterium]|uniref:RnfABCDGE type electron transport complex subunit G n=1 Tax=Tepidanaerobacter sp. GT38 TaxID=2722793 RepID=UPI0017D7A1F3|nr:RnfABCDGE type electron transport complex subunit G [Tepidanaerobacter sp. GT38]MCG1011892.1 RnfABCDGE type electron transport complex subunit G [Tepidanaerobacter sp. GT38]HHY42531.1 RnfABCDGE type electron transport complex subunit G [Thermoanaerobacterales bacterium]